MDGGGKHIQIGLVWCACLHEMRHEVHDQLYNVVVSGAERETMVHLKDATPFDIVRFIFSLGKDQKDFKNFQTHGDNLL